MMGVCSSLKARGRHDARCQRLFDDAKKNLETLGMIQRDALLFIPKLHIYYGMNMGGNAPQR